MTAHKDTSSEVFMKGFFEENPTFVMMLGMCPTLAVSNKVINGISMGLAATFVLVLSCALISLIRRHVPKQVRIATFVMVIATFVTMVGYFIQAISIDIHKALGPFIPLIVVNCVILGRAEAFACKNNVWRSILDALGMGIGFSGALILIAAIREILGFGTFLGFPVLGGSYEPWAVMILPPGGFLTLGSLMLLLNWGIQRKRRKATQA